MGRKTKAAPQTHGQPYEFGQHRFGTALGFSIVTAVLFVSVIIGFQSHPSTKWRPDVALLQQITSALPNCEVDNCCPLPHMPLATDTVLPRDEFYYGPLLFENLTARWSALEAWQKSAMLRNHKATIVQASSGSEIAQKGALHIPGTPGAVSSEDIQELELQELIGSWDNGQHNRFLFTTDRAQNRGKCTSLKCLLTDVSGVNSDAETSEFEVPVALARMQSLVLSLGPTAQGLPLHSHGSAWLTLVHGYKLWLFYPPGQQPENSWNLAAADILDMWNSSKLVAPYYCLQRPGDTVVLPHLWAHATMNIGDSVGVGGQVSGNDLSNLLQCVKPLVTGRSVSSYAEAFAQCELQG